MSTKTTIVTFPLGGKAAAISGGILSEFGFKFDSFDHGLKVCFRDILVNTANYPWLSAA